MPRWFWGYFVSYKELVEIFLDAGGTLSPSAKLQDIHAERQARRCIFKYLMPGHIEITLNHLDGAGGFTFKIGPKSVKLKDIDKHLLSRCWDMFLRDPDQFMYTDNPLVFTTEHNGEVHRLDHLEDIESDRTTEWYYLDKYRDDMGEKAARAQAAARAQVEPEAASTVTTGA